jgi:hypothetical protein
MRSWVLWSNAVSLLYKSPLDITDIVIAEYGISLNDIIANYFAFVNTFVEQGRRAM